LGRREGESVVPTLLASFHLARDRINTLEKNRMDDHPVVSKSALTSECNIALGQ